MILCAFAVIINYTSTWIEIDNINMRAATKRCKIYYPKSPCLVKFIKKEEQVYHAICGVSKNRR